MSGPFTGSTGWTGTLPLLLGGAPLVNTFSRSMPSPLAGPAGTPQARPYIAHVYQNDGVTPLGTLTVLTRPNLKRTGTNGGFDQVLLDVSTRKTTPVYGQVIYGQPVYGNQVNVGNIIRLTEQGGDGNFLYMGIVEDLPDSIGPGGVTHQILLTHPVVELQECFSQSLYTTPTDVAQLARDAFAQTQHISCDQISVPPATGIFVATTGAVDFRNQTCQQQLDIARSTAGPTWFWHVDEVGRGWFQAMGSAANYTVTRAQVEQRTLSTSIKDRKNQVLAIGGVPAGGGAPVTGTYNGSSQSSIGIRALNPPLSVPNITDQGTVSFIANNIGLVLDRIWTRADSKLPTATLKQRPIMQPGGIMVREFEPVKAAMQESEAGSGGYVGPFVAQTIDDSGSYLQVVAGDIPVTSQTDVQNMVLGLVARAAANLLQVIPAALNKVQVFSGSLIVGSTTQASGLAVGRMELGSIQANGVSPAQEGWRINDFNGNPLADSQGLIGVMSQLGHQHGSGSQVITNTSDNLLDDGAGNQATITFTLARQARVKLEATISAHVTQTSSASTGGATVQVDGVDQDALINDAIWGAAGSMTVGAAASAPLFWSEPLAAGTHTIKIVGFTDGTVGTNLVVTNWDMAVYLLGT